MQHLAEVAIELNSDNAQDMRSRTLRIQLLSAEDPSLEEDETKIGRWRQYVGTYVTRYPTELVPQGKDVRAKAEKSRVFLKRCVYFASLSISGAFFV